MFHFFVIYVLLMSNKLYVLSEAARLKYLYVRSTVDRM